MTREMFSAEHGEEKVVSFENVAKAVAIERASGKTVGLVTGCFDILHVGHIDLFRYAKRHVDVLVVGVERDATLQSKNPDRPINKLDWRCKVLSELSSVDLIYSVEFVIEYKPSPENNALYTAMYKKIKPDFLITNPVADRYWKLKQQNAKEMGMGFLGLEHERLTSSTEIIDKIQKSI